MHSVNSKVALRLAGCKTDTKGAFTFAGHKSFCAVLMDHQLSMSTLSVKFGHSIDLFGIMVANVDLNANLQK